VFVILPPFSGLSRHRYVPETVNPPAANVTGLPGNGVFLMKRLHHRAAALKQPVIAEVTEGDGLGSWRDSGHVQQGRKMNGRP